MSLRVRGGVAAQESCAATAASSARMPSAGDASAIVRTTSLVAGSRTSKVLSPSAATHSPAM
jgi:hypothetical protein